MEGSQTPLEFYAVATVLDLHLVRRAYVPPQAFEAENPDFMSSLGPHDRDDLLDTFENEWADVLLNRRKDNI